MKVIIASDFHLKYDFRNFDEKKRTEKALAFFDSLIGNTDVLILNGDVFDFWISWKNVIIEAYFPVLKKLSEISESGCRIIYVAGNHDFWLGDFLKNFIKAELYKEHFKGEIDGKTYFVTHGDSYLAGDLRYKAFRMIIRSKLVRYVVNLFHPDFILGMASLMSRSSRKRVFPKWLIGKRKEQLATIAKTMNYDFIVFGHTHKPEIKNWGEKYYLNAGDWTKHYSYIEIKNGVAELIFFSVF